MKKKMKVQSSLSNKPPLLRKKRSGLLLGPASDDSLTTPRKNLKKEIEPKEIAVLITVRTKLTFNRRQLCLVSGHFLRKVLSEGINLNDLILAESLLSFLLGQKLSPIDLKDERELELALALQSIIFGVKDLTLEDKKVEISERIRSFLNTSRFIPAKRTAGSWSQKYSVEKFFSVRAVSEEELFSKSSHSIPYDSYCKGYGESHPSRTHQKTRYSSELDGEEVDFERERSIFIPLRSIRFYLLYQDLEREYLGKI